MTCIYLCKYLKKSTVLNNALPLLDSFLSPDTGPSRPWSSSRPGWRCPDSSASSKPGIGKLPLAWNLFYSDPWEIPTVDPPWGSGVLESRNACSNFWILLLVWVQKGPAHMNWLKIAHNYGPLRFNTVLLWGVVACYFGLLSPKPVHHDE